jgi:mannose-1-phosphate guanylyltransferase
MRALLLAAGLGTRLRPLTDYLPKCLVPIHGRPLIDYWLELLVNNGFNEILVNTHYLAPLVIKYVLGSRWAHHVTLVHEEKLLGTGGTILANKSIFQEEPFLVAHADNLTIFDPLAFIRSHQARPDGCEITMMLFKTLDPKSCGIVDVDQYGIVKTFYEKALSPPGNLANAAVYILEPAVLDFIAKLDKIEVDLSTEVIPHFIGRISTYLNNSYHRDIGTIESWQDAQRDFPACYSKAIEKNLS